MNGTILKSHDFYTYHFMMDCYSYNYVIVMDIVATFGSLQIWKNIIFILAPYIVHLGEMLLMAVIFLSHPSLV